MKKLVMILIMLLITSNAIILTELGESAEEIFSPPSKNLQEWSLGMNINNVSSVSFIGENQGDQLKGYSALYINEDDYADFVLMAPDNNEGGGNAGKVYLVFGDENGMGNNISASDADVIFVGGPGDRIYGLGVGNLDGDRYNDILIMSSQSNGDRRGKVLIFFGRTTEEWADVSGLSDADASFIGENEGDRAGHMICSTYDCNGNGIDDVLIHSKYNDEGGDQAGQVYLIYGKSDRDEWGLNTPLSEADASFIGEKANDYFGNYVGGIADFDGDGLYDFTISTNPTNGDKAKLYLIYGKEGGWAIDTLITDAADAIFVEERKGDGFLDGWVGDINGDGIEDLVFGTIESDEFDKAGKTYIFFGNGTKLDRNATLADADTIIYCRDGSNKPTHGAVQSGDLNGDGIHDLIYISQYSDTGGTDAGEIYIIFGKPGKWASEMDLSDADITIVGERPGDRFGEEAHMAGDINWDGYEDLIVNARYYDLNENSRDHGKVYVIYGKPSLGDPPEVEIDEDYIRSQLVDGVLSGDLEIKWNATDLEDIDNLTTNLTIDIFHRTLDTWWTPIVEGMDNTGWYIWNTTDPHVPDDKYYMIRIKVKDSTNKITTKDLSFTFEIDNPDRPELDVIYPVSGNILTGFKTISWIASDDEDDESDLLVKIKIWGNGGQTDDTLANDLNNTGSFILDTSQFSDGNYFMTIEIKDTTGLSVMDIVGPFTIFNTPGIEIFMPEQDEVLSGMYKVRWNAVDPGDLKGDLSVDIWMIYADGTEQQILMGGENSGEYEFNSSQFENGENYSLRLQITDPTGLSSTVMSDNFTIWNSNIPQVEFISPIEFSFQREAFILNWNATDIEDDSDDLKVVLYYKLQGTELWRELAYDILNTGSFVVHSTELIDGDGLYSFMIKVRDTHGMISESDEMSLNVYNPDAPVIKYPEGPSEPIRDGTAEFEWIAEDPDPGETDDLLVWIYVSTDGIEWTTMADGIESENSYIMDVTGLEDTSYQVKIKVADMQEGEDYRETEAMFPQELIVNNVNDAPVIEFIDSPQANIEYSKEIYLNWTGFDADGDTILYTLFYKGKDDTDWMEIENAVDIRSTSFIWNVSRLKDGYYQVKIIGVEDYEDSLSMEQLTDEFFVKEVKLTLGDEDRQVTINYGLLFGVGAGFVILALVVIYIMFLSVRKKEEEEEYEEENETNVGLGEEDQSGPLETDEDTITPEVIEDQDLEGAPSPPPPLSENDISQETKDQNHPGEE